MDHLRAGLPGHDPQLHLAHDAVQADPKGGEEALFVHLPDAAAGRTEAGRGLPHTQ